MSAQISALETTVRAGAGSPRNSKNAATPSEGVAALALRFGGEFREMPGLHLTSRQAARLFGVEADVARAVLDELRRASVLTLSGDGTYSLIAEPASRNARGASARNATGRTDRMGTRLGTNRLVDAPFNGGIR